MGKTREQNEGNMNSASEAIEHPSAAPTSYPTGLKLAIILLSLSLGTLLVALDTTIISVAIPKISTEFKALDQVGWYGSAYLITLTAFQPITGNMYKSFNPKWVYSVFIVIFEGRFVVPLASNLWATDAVEIKHG